jgi:hypothetical protein
VLPIPTHCYLSLLAMPQSNHNRHTRVWHVTCPCQKMPVGRTHACLLVVMTRHSTACMCLLIDCLVVAGCLALLYAARCAAVSATAFCGACRCCIMLLVTFETHPLAWIRPAYAGVDSESGTIWYHTLYPAVQNCNGRLAQSKHVSSYDSIQEGHCMWGACPCCLANAGHCHPCQWCHG